jgi:small subunit ribosomal protein S9
MQDEEQNRPDDAPEQEGAPPEETPTPEEEQPAAAEEPTPEAEEPTPEEQPPPAEEPTSEEQPAAEEAPPAEEEPPAAAEETGEQPAAEEPAPEGEAGTPDEEQPRRRTGRDKKEPKEEVIPGAHLEPDLVLEEERRREQGEFGEYGEPDAEGEEAAGEPGAEAPDQPQPVERKALDLAADARYRATGKRKSAVARVILKPGSGAYAINGRELNAFFPRPRLQNMARQPLETAGYETRMDVVAKIHGGGVSSQATALRHGIARALVEADPALRAELKRKGFLTRDPRVKERKKAGLKKARKRPQFSKR